MSRKTRFSTSQNIYNHYYIEAGFDLNRLKYKTITDSDDLNRHLSEFEIKDRNEKYTSGRREQLEGTGFAITRVGGYANFGEYLKYMEVEISIGYDHLGKNLDTSYDIMSICSHEHKHLEDCLYDVENKTKINSETRAYQHQTLVDENWKLTSFRFKAGLYKLSPVIRVMYKEDIEKAFGDKKQYANFNPYEFKSKNITL